MKFNFMFLLSLIGIVLGNMQKVSLIAYRKPIYSSYDILITTLLSTIIFFILIYTIRQSRTLLEQLIMVLTSLFYSYINMKDLLYGINIYLYYDFILGTLDLSVVLSSFFLIVMTVLRVRYAPKEKKIKPNKKYKSKSKSSLIFEDYNDIIIETQVFEDEIFEEEDLVFNENSVYLD